MTLESFQSLIRILANQAWVRYYLHMIPGSMVMELAVPNGSLEPTQLAKELAEKGFSPLAIDQSIAGLRLYRWSILRTDLQTNVPSP